MSRFEIKDKNRKVAVAAMLGALTLLTNIFANLAFDSSWTPFGNIFLFISAIALGPFYALISIGSGSALHTLMLTENLEGLRVVLLTLSIGYCAKRFPRFPSFLVCLGLWMLVFAPALVLLEQNHIVSGIWTNQRIVFMAISEISLCMIAGALLLNNNLWCLITNQPRHVPFSTVIAHILNMISMLSVLASLFAFNLLSGNQIDSIQVASSSNLIWVAGLMVVAFIVPTLCGERLASLLINNPQGLAGGQLYSVTQAMRTGNFKSNSGTNWQRSSSGSNERMERTGNPNDSETNIPSPKMIDDKKGICALNKNGTISFVNRRFLKLVEANNRDALGKNINALAMNPALLKEINQVLLQSFEKGPRRSECKIKQTNGNLRFYQIESQLPSNNNQSAINSDPDGVILTVEEITDRRTIESHLLISQKASSLGKMVGGMAHEFNNALTTIAGEAGVAINNPADQDKLKVALSKISDITQKAGDTVRQLLKFADNKPLQSEVRDLNQLLSEKLDLLKKLVGEDFEICFEGPKNANQKIRIDCDENLLVQALANLIQNSKESYNGPGKIVISLDCETIDDEVSALTIGAKAGVYARLRVKDFGFGMNRDILARAFDPLFSTKTSRGHSGLGLSIVHSIARAHDGFLTAESHPGKGTTISIYIPLKDSNQKDQLEPTVAFDQRIADIAGNQESILIVEDESTVREMLVSMLSSLNYKVISCDNGEAALNESKKNKFDLILVDMIMPKMRGLDLIKEIKNIDSQTKTMLMTGYGAHVDQHKAACSVIYKPFDMQSLGRAVKDIIGCEKNEEAAHRHTNLN